MTNKKDATSWRRLQSCKPTQKNVHFALQHFFFSIWPHLKFGTGLSNRACKTTLHNLILISRPSLMNIGSREGDCRECRSHQPIQQKQVWTPVTLVLIRANHPSDNTAIIRYMVTICPSLCHQDQNSAYNFCARSKDYRQQITEEALTSDYRLQKSIHGAMTQFVFFLPPWTKKLSPQFTCE